MLTASDSGRAADSEEPRSNQPDLERASPGQRHLALVQNE